MSAEPQTSCHSLEPVERSAPGAVLLVVAGTAGGTGALWQDNAALNPGTVTTGSLELLAGGSPESYVFTTLSTDNLAPGASVPDGTRTGPFFALPQP
mgnify:CR=1 FL=1